MAGSIRIHAKILDEILNHARREPLTECCGLLAGRDGIIETILPAKNAMNSATLYEIAPTEMFQLFREMREQGLTHLGQYHSHLHTENIPSPTDIEQAGYPDHAYFIVTLLPNALVPVRAFSIRDSTFSQLVVIVTNNK
ncbi:MAG TPA: M67 family metallopeptidase [Candidatus Saccharimonadales bacterium]|jgi:proteasome lid subunit RPN8/RPN11|nr:M67 family metallopeptidase [Candidatus Saccharimonadales bacterium]